MTWEASARIFLGHIKDAMRAARKSAGRAAVLAA
jgi:hypothetical protein